MTPAHTRHFIVRGKFLGSAPAEGRMFDGSYIPPIGHVFVCGLCGEAWAIAPIEGEGFNALMRPCEKHRPGDSIGHLSPGHVWRCEVPGALWIDWDRRWNAGLPAAAIRRELLLTLAWASSTFPEPVASMCGDMAQYLKCPPAKPATLPPPAKETT